MKNAIKNQDGVLTKLQKTLHFPDETIDFTQKRIWLQQVEKHETNSFLLVSVLLSAAVVIVLLAAITIVSLIYSNSIVK